MVEQKKQGAIAMENKIILIEDDEEIRSMVKDYLSGEFQVLPLVRGKQPFTLSRITMNTLLHS